MSRIINIGLLFFSGVLFSQGKADSLQKVLPRMADDSLKVNALLSLAWETNRNDLGQSLQYATRARELAEKLNLTPKVAAATRIEAFSFLGMGHYANADSLLKKTLGIYQRLGNQRMVADTYTELGRLKQLQMDYEQSISYLLEALTRSRELKDENNEARTYNYLAGVYKAQKQYDKAIENYESALALVRKLDIKPGISACLTNLAGVYSQLGDYEKAVAYHEESLEIKMALNDKLGTSRVLNNLGNAYNNLGQYNKAGQFFDQAYELALEVGDQRQIATVEYGRVETAFGMNDYRRTIALANNLLDHTDSLTDLTILVETYHKLFRAYGEVGAFGQAYESGRKWQAYSDSLYNKNILEVTNGLEAQYQNEQKTREIALLASDKELQRLQLQKRVNERNVIIAFSLLALILAGLLYNQYRIKQRSNRELKELDTLKSHFFANISHEFRTPLTLIKGPIEQLEQNPGEHLSRDDIKMIRRNTNRVLGLVNQLLDLSRIDQGKMKLKPTEGDIFKLLRRAAASFSSHAAQRHMDYKIHIPDRVLWAAFDRDKLEKIVYNLLANSFKFSDDGEMVSFEASYRNEELTIQVGDSGKGISPEQLPFIFDRFYQASSGLTKEREGTGIGLSLSRDLVELMDGTITVSSELHKGTYFTVQLPLQQIMTRHVASELPEPEMPPFDDHPASLPFPKADSRKLPEVLLVEDNEDMRHYIRSRLMHDYRVAEAINGENGLQMACDRVPDLVITDLMMPKMDGVELCRQLKTRMETSHIPVIMLTARAGIENKIEGLETGADDYLTKPFDTAELTARVKNLIEQRRRLRERYSMEAARLRPGAVSVSSLDGKFLERVLALLEDNYADPDFGLPQMQQALGMSKTQLHRKLRALTDESPGEALRNFRLERAAQLLSQNADTVTQVAYSVGFNNLSYFAKCFKEHFGVSPSSFSA